MHTNTHAVSAGTSADVVALVVFVSGENCACIFNNDKVIVKSIFKNNVSAEKTLSISNRTERNKYVTLICKIVY